MKALAVTGWIGGRWRVLASFAVFQVAWFAAVTAAAQGAPGWGTAAVVVAIALQLSWSDRPASDLWLVAIAMAVGAVWDTGVVRSGWIEYASPGPFPGFVPGWLLGMWALFAMTLREPMQWMHGRHGLAVLFGAVGGPLSYVAAERMGTCRFPDTVLALGLIAVGWAVMTPLLVEAARRLQARSRA